MGSHHRSCLAAVLLASACSSPALRSAVAPSKTSGASNSARATTSTPGPDDLPPATADAPAATTSAPGPALPPAQLLTDQNRHAPTMMGGWGPHLRSLLRLADGSRWFAAESGGDVTTDSTMVYYRDEGTSWSSHPLAITPGVQQNMATVTDGRVLYSYGVDVDDHWLVECYDDTGPGGQAACNAALTGLASDTNYVGAAITPAGTRVVWWTQVGDGGGAGQFWYAYNSGGGWNGPVNSSLGSFNDVGYVNAQVVGPDQLLLLGQGWSGGTYPNGTFTALAARLVLGQNVAWQPLPADGASGSNGQSSVDLYYDAPSQMVHLLSIVGTTVAYRAVPAADYPGQLPAQPTHVFPSSYRMRFHAGAGGPLQLIRDDSSARQLQVLTAPAGAQTSAIDWTKATESTLPYPSAVTGSGWLTAIYPESADKQTTAMGSLSFVFCGQFPGTDNDLWAVISP